MKRSQHPGSNPIHIQKTLDYSGIYLFTSYNKMILILVVPQVVKMFVKENYGKCYYRFFPIDLT